MLGDRLGNFFQDNFLVFYVLQKQKCHMFVKYCKICNPTYHRAFFYRELNVGGVPLFHAAGMKFCTSDNQFKHILEVFKYLSWLNEQFFYGVGKSVKIGWEVCVSSKEFIMILVDYLKNILSPAEHFLAW